MASLSPLLVLLFALLGRISYSLRLDAGGAPSVSRRAALSAASVFLPRPAFGSEPPTTIAIARGQPSSVALRDGSLMPAVGFGTCCRKTAKGPPLTASAESYLAQGGRLIDTAQLYGNEGALAVAIRESGVPRAQMWITDKVNTYGGAGVVSTRAGALASVDGSLSALGVPYIDLMLIHGTWTIGPAEQVEVWRGLLDAKARGLVRHVGVSNFERDEIERLEAATGARPLVNQLEYHPWVPAATRELVRWCQRSGIAVTAYGSLGGSSSRAGETSPEGASVARIATEHGATNAQVLLRWALAQGVAVIPGATSDKHIRENLYPPEFELTGQDLALLAGTDRPRTFVRWNNLSGEA